jgi:N-acetylneuraminic acid mutarotase
MLESVLERISTGRVQRWSTNVPPARRLTLLALAGLAMVALSWLAASHAGASIRVYTTWTFRARPPSYPQTPTMARERSGRMLAWSFCDDVCVGKVWEYNPQTNAWRRRASLPVAVRHAAGAAVGGQVYSIGGIDGETYRALVYAYDPATDTWTRKADIPEPVAAGKTAVASGDIFVAGERAAGGANQLYRYDPAADAWTLETTIPNTSTVDYALAAIHGVIYVAGSGLYPRASQRVLTYTIATKTWSHIAPMPHARLDPAAIRGADLRLYVFGGQAAGFCCRSLRSVDVYNPRTRRWSTGPPMLVGRQFPATALGAGGGIYALGGVIDGDLTARSIEILR